MLRFLTLKIILWLHVKAKHYEMFQRPYMFHGSVKRRSYQMCYSTLHQYVCRHNVLPPFSAHGLPFGLTWTVFFCIKWPDFVISVIDTVILTQGKASSAFIILSTRIHPYLLHDVNVSATWYNCVYSFRFNLQARVFPASFLEISVVIFS